MKRHVAGALVCRIFYTHFNRLPCASRIAACCSPHGCCLCLSSLYFAAYRLKSSSMCAQDCHVLFATWLLLMHLLGLSSLYFAAYRLKTSSICAGLPRVVHHVAGAQTLRRTASARSAPTTSGRKVRRLSSYISADPMIL